MEGKLVDHVPFCPNLAYLWETFPQDLQALGHHGFFDLIDCDHLHRFAPCPVKRIEPDIQREEAVSGGLTTVKLTTPVGSLQYAYRYSEVGGTRFLVEHPLKKPEDYKIRLWMEERTRFEADYACVGAYMDSVGNKGVPIGMLIPERCKSAYQALVEHEAGTEELIYAVADYPQVVEELWAAMVRNNLKAVEIAAQAEYDYFLTWEDSSTQNYSPAQYDRYIAPEITQWCAILKASGKRYIQHACGHVKALLPSMKASGAFGIESISPAPTGNLTIADARVIAGPDFLIIGGLEPTEFLARDGENLIEYTVETIAQGGRAFVLANSDSCPPGVTVEKMRLVAQVARGTPGK
jgi:hypothetical protein